MKIELNIKEYSIQNNSSAQESAAAVFIFIQIPFLSATKMAAVIEFDGPYVICLFMQISLRLNKLIFEKSSKILVGVQLRNK